MILATLLPWLLGAFVLAMLLAAWRLLAGPSLPDRILALDTLTINALALVLLLGIARGAALYFDLALLIALLGFVGTVVLAKFARRGGIVE